MLAATITGPRRIELVVAPMPSPGPGQVRVKIEGSGLCASSLPLWQGRPWFAYPLAPGVPGHEAWGRVDALGEGAGGVERGARVAILATHAFAEYDLAAANELVTLPDAFAGRPFPGEPLACAINAFARAEVGPQHTVAVVGAGFLGTLMVALAARAGARVLAISRRAYALEQARRYGACELLEFDRNPLAAVRQLTAGRGCERVIEAVGSQQALDLAASLVAQRGCLIIAGYHQDGPRTIDLRHWNWLGLDVINAHERAPEVYVAGLQAAIAAVLAGRLDPLALLTHSFPLARLDEAFTALEERAPGFVKALVTL